MTATGSTAKLGTTATAPLEESDLRGSRAGVGEVLAGKYLVERQLRAGGMGIVMCARHLQLQERVAVKVLHGAAASCAGAVARFLREARAAARVKSDHVVRILDFGTLDTGDPYLVMEFLEGSDLRQLLSERGPLPISETIDYLLQVCEGLRAAHAQGIVHRDLKPSNLFLTRASDGSARIKILDFGIAKALNPVPGTVDEDHTLTAATELLGSPAYMSPEQIRCASGVDERTDIWSLGVILYELISGRQPFESPTISGLLAAIAADTAAPVRQHRPEVSKELEALIAECLAKDPSQRIASATLLAERLRLVREGGSAVQGSRVTSKRLAFASVGLMLCGAAVWGFRSFGHGETAAANQNNAEVRPEPAATAAAFDSKPRVEPDLTAPPIAPASDLSASPLLPLPASAARPVDSDLKLVTTAHPARRKPLRAGTKAATPVVRAANLRSQTSATAPNPSAQVNRESVEASAIADRK